VVVCCRDRPELLAEALPAVQQQLRDGDILVVVDSASRTSQVQEVARAAGVDVRRLSLPGLSRARNVGWRAVGAEVVLFTDDDCRPLPGWRDAAVAAFADPSVGAAWGSVVADRESGVPLSVGLDELPELSADSDLSMTGHGACMAFRRSALEALGGFDELLGAGGTFRAGEDKDGFWRVHELGLRVVAVPTMAVTHVVHRDDRQALRVMHGYGMGAGVVARKRSLQDEDGHLLRDELWRHGMLPAYHWGRQRRFAAAAGALGRGAGVLRGWWSTRGWVVRDGHLVPPGA
jgi:GT2 family glycosyltransferase